MKFSIYPPKVDFSNAEEVHIIKGMGILENDADFDEAFQEACDKGLLMPRHKEKYCLLPAVNLGTLVMDNNKDGWQTYRGDGMVLCSKPVEHEKRLITYKKLKEICNNRQASQCSLLDAVCSDRHCPIWNKRLKKYKKTEQTT